MKKQDNLNRLYKQGRIILLSSGIVFLIYCVMGFFLAFHNLDNIQNTLMLSNSFNNGDFYNSDGDKINFDFNEITDTGGDFNTRPLKNYYIDSMNKLKMYFLFGLIDCLLIGMLIDTK